VPRTPFHSVQIPAKACKVGRPGTFPQIVIVPRQPVITSPSASRRKRYFFDAAKEAVSLNAKAAGGHLSQRVRTVRCHVLAGFAQYAVEGLLKGPLGKDDERLSARSCATLCHLVPLCTRSSCHSGGGSDHPEVSAWPVIGRIIDSAKLSIPRPLLTMQRHTSERRRYQAGLRLGHSVKAPMRLQALK
jgi:hypothetical protein